VVVNIGIPADEAMELPVDRRVAFAARVPERLYVENMNTPAPIVDQAGFLKLARYERDTAALHTQHLRQESCVKGSVPLLRRSRVCNSHRLSRSSSSCSALHATCWTCADAIWSYLTKAKRSVSLSDKVLHLVYFDPEPRTPHLANGLIIELAELILKSAARGER
jgi:hypothetical protein